jgi:hypothetical protein
MLSRLPSTVAIKFRSVSRAGRDQGNVLLNSSRVLGIGRIARVSTFITFPQEPRFYPLRNLSIPRNVCQRSPLDMR